MRKSVRLGGGVRLNLGLRGVGVSYGVRGLRYSVHSSGRRTMTTSIPGTGVSYVVSGSGRGSKKRGSPSRMTRQTVTVVPPEPSAGLFAPAYEKEFSKGMHAYNRGDAAGALEHFSKASSRDQDNKAVTDDLFAGVLLVKAGRHGDAIAHLERVVSAAESLPDKLMTKYVRSWDQVEISITSQVVVQLPWSSLLATLALAEAYQQVGRLEEAIGLVQQVAEIDHSPAWQLSLAELLSESKDWHDLVEVAAGVENTDDTSLQVKLLQAEALVALGLSDAALEVYRDCLRSRKRNADLLLAARYGRGRLLLDLGKRTQALRELGQVYAHSPTYRDVASLVATADSSHRS